MAHTTQSRPAQDKVCGYEYTVRRGDSLYLIANRLGVPLRDLLEANSHINPARLMVGDVLCIPMEEDDAPAEPVPPEEPLPDEDLDVPAAPPEEPPVQEPALPQCTNGSPYVVSAGETAADIQLRTDLNLHTLQSANPGADLTRLQEGQTLCIPDSSQPCPTAVTYVLQADDTLESAALRFNASLSAMLRANPCLAPSDFRPGMCIYVPDRSGS